MSNGPRGLARLPRPQGYDLPIVTITILLPLTYLRVCLVQLFHRSPITMTVISIRQGLHTHVSSLEQANHPSLSFGNLTLWEINTLPAEPR